MSEDIRKMIDKVKNFKSFVNENYNSDILCDVFNLKTTGMAYYDGVIKNDGSQYKHSSPQDNIIINEQNPIKFILKYMTLDDYGKIIKRTMTDPNYIQNEKILKIMGNMQKGIKYDTPMIDLVDKYNFQEGRHRVIAANKLGCELIPVYIFGLDVK
jgi:thermostable 8-oxoguanine DNA glycosylase